MISREEARLRTLFRRLALLSIATSPLACSTSPGAADTPADATVGGADAALSGEAGLDATTPIDATSVFDAGAGVVVDRYGFTDAACDPIYLDGEADGSGCDFFESLPCGLPPGAVTENCYLLLAQCGVLCNQTVNLKRVCAIDECLYVDGSTIPSVTPLTLECATGEGACAPGAGRRPQGLRSASPARRGDAVGSALAEQARLEAASVRAFRRLGAELGCMRAPRSLVRAAERSARDEVRHARVLARLAWRHGAVPAKVAVTRGRRARSLEAFAIENAVEGCVRECFGALVATRQATCASDPELARAMDRIARDETRHAALAWKIARWVDGRLDEAARARVRRAASDALAALRCEAASMPGGLARALGVATGDDARRLVDAFEAALFPSSSA